MSAAIIVFLAFFSTAQQGLSQPITSRVIVKMDDSPGVNLAAETLAQNVPNTLIVDYNSLAYHLVIWRAYGEVVWIGHGSQQGISTVQGILTWQEFAVQVKTAPSRDFILACDSNAILSYLPASNILMSFSGPTDARLGALMISYLLTGKTAVLEKGFTVALNLLEGKTSLVPLGTIPGSANDIARTAVKVAVYLALVYAVDCIWSLFADPGAGFLVLAALVLAIGAFGALVGGIAVDIIQAGLEAWAPSWGWFSWIPNGLAWLIENAGILIFGGVVATIDPTVLGIALSSQYEALFFVGLWLFVSTLVDTLFDMFGLFRDF
jgi:hypothetical protein